MAANLVSFDFAIKYLLKDKSGYEIVEGFISALLKTGGYGPVKINALLDTESNRESSWLKKSIADLIVEDEQQHKYIVEIERVPTRNFIHKACFNSCRLIVDSVTTGNDYTTIKKVFHISLLYFKPEDMVKPLCHGKTIMREIDTEHPLDMRLGNLKGEIFELSQVLPEYFVISVPLFNDVINQEIDEWLYVMKHSETKEDFKSPYMKKVAARLNQLKMSPAERDEYHHYIKDAITQRDAVAAAEVKGRAEGEAKGRAAGKAEGEAKGRAKGKEEGRAEGKTEEKLLIASKMLAQNIPLKTIAEITGLTINQISDLKKSNNKTKK